MPYSRYDIVLAEKEITAEFQYDETAVKFGEYCLGPSKKATGIRVPEYELKTWKSFGYEYGPQFEFSCFTAAASVALSFFNRFIIHAVAFQFIGNAYLILAPSGGGKSTLLKALQELYPGEISVICGDRPVIWEKQEKDIWVYPSPWNGKENWSGSVASPLGGLIILKRVGKTGVSLLKKKEAAANVYSSLIMMKENAEEIHRFAMLASIMIDSVPVWRLDSIEAKDSAVVLYDSIKDMETKNEI